MSFGQMFSILNQHSFLRLSVGMANSVDPGHLFPPKILNSDSTLISKSFFYDGKQG